MNDINNNPNLNSNLRTIKIVLLTLVGLRLLGTLLSGLENFSMGPSANIYLGVIYLFSALLYLVGFLGVLKKSKSAIIVLIILVTIDALSAITAGKFVNISSAAYDIVVGYLAYRVYKA